MDKRQKRKIINYSFRDGNLFILEMVATPTYPNAGKWA
jgi:hypothetical protein